MRKEGKSERRREREEKGKERTVGEGEVFLGGVVGVECLCSKDKQSKKEEKKKNGDVIKRIMTILCYDNIVLLFGAPQMPLQ